MYQDRPLGLDGMKIRSFGPTQRVAIILNGYTLTAKVLRNRLLLLQIRYFLHFPASVYWQNLMTQTCTRRNIIIQIKMRYTCIHLKMKCSPILAGVQKVQPYCISIRHPSLCFCKLTYLHMCERDASCIFFHDHMTILQI